ncbi:YIP1 family protein [Seohaeicola saemankumensis]|jgi:hypothetical protein|uniref:Yip1 family protein n=1 Tax=Seohaeicola TaxID=481178 RepID=UPI0007F36CBD|nr:YIP1 family protein [Paracoccaceae bacterium]OAN65316.1 hypothetical protein A8B83_06195 [Rhodobacteraceae bacterium EhC02]
MTLKDLAALAMDTLRDPRGTGERLIALNLGLPVLWTALALASVLSALLFSINMAIFPAAFPMPGLFFNPILYAVVLAGGMVISMHLLTWMGTMLGGRGSLAEVTVLLVWLQYLRLVAQAGLLLLTMIMPPLGMMATIVVAFYSLWLLLNFLDVAHRFGSLAKALVVLLMTAVGIVVGLSFLLALIGVPATEMS